MRISKRVREQAAMICAIAASTPDLAESYDMVVAHLDADRGPSLDLAMCAWRRVDKAAMDLANIDAEAEAMLRTGWSP